MSEPVTPMLKPKVAPQSEYSFSIVMLHLRAVSLACWSTPEGLHLLGIILEGRGKDAEAEKSYSTAVKRKRSLVDAWFRLGNLRYERGDLERAIEAYEGFLIHAGKEVPEETTGMVRARIREMRGRLDENR